MTQRLYDCHRNAPAVIPHPGLTPEDVLAFCEEMHIGFHAVGTPGDWENQEVFRVGTHTVPSRGLDVKFSKVLEWKAAVASIGEKVFEDGRYRSFKGEMVTTICSATDTRTGGKVVVYRDEAGQVFTMPIELFFDVTTHDEILVARFQHLP
ncbi:DUF1653 domain-containing protein [Pseudomonas aeruginosa]|jgi:hypothetical protein|nr:DUF1653 domain-containing protein [Pseudomonas aeruginosa]EKX2969312.1 DUF1653 domain-containing protein [Pseudomonas aeruginosa]HBO8004306.1 DUF1653 domain-containing protein [Pseudomonas aeruginosa]